MMQEEVAGSVERGGSHSSSWLLVTSPDYDNKPINHLSSSYCNRLVNLEDVFFGPRSAFHECYNPMTDTIVKIWTGSLTEMVPPEGWVMDPAPCLNDVDGDE